MYQEKIATAELLNQQRLAAYRIGEEDQQAFARISAMLRPHSISLATEYLDRFLSAAGLKLDDATRSSQIEKSADYGRNKFTPPIDDSWIRRVEKIGALQFKLRAPSYAHLSALNVTHCMSMQIILDEASSIQEGRYLVEAFMRIAALEVDIMISTIQSLEQEAFRDQIAKNAQTFEQSISAIVASTTTDSANANEKARDVAKAARELLTLSNDVATASTQTSSAMSEAARMSGGLGTMIENIEHELSTAFASFSELSDAAKRAKDSSSGLLTHTKSIDQIVSTINSIADQTKILALNALIEAASSGKYGAGFSVVANEMKVLATQTEAATQEIGAQLQQISDSSNRSVGDYTSMSEKFDGLRQTAERLQASVAEQGKSVQAIAACIDETSQSAEFSAHAIREINQRTEGVSANIGDVQAKVSRLDEELNRLQASADTFLRSLHG
ncbi:methyl-accepting chemotaxis protein [Qipengyuania atrilutea]|uniref:Methyl-accepting transducer domain-containing protein n=1 Tax=Qipengyuania atrilutea TaxID=2744473 RepID=A0A850HD70_9SPHN|nr:methyl-accepting chemotaxis protein [Actirhodobacter atriluteus]NVD45089.1 hypothetical protein [Actirhodobacter atriluteus]